MKPVREDSAPAEKIGPPFQRVIRHLAAPWTTGTKNFWLGTSAVDPGFSSNEHAHDGQEEAFYCIAGKGKIRVGGEAVPVEPGDLVYVPPGIAHQLVNDGREIFKVVAVVSPPFIPEKFKKDHQLA